MSSQCLLGYPDRFDATLRYSKLGKVNKTVLVQFRSLMHYYNRSILKIYGGDRAPFVRARGAGHSRPMQGVQAILSLEFMARRLIR